MPTHEKTTAETLEKKLKKDAGPAPGREDTEISLPAKISQEPIEDPEEDVALPGQLGLVPGREIPHFLLAAAGSGSKL